jgi:hypothetical protein
MREISKLPELVVARVLLLDGRVDVLHLQGARASADADADAPRRISRAESKNRARTHNRHVLVLRGKEEKRDVDLVGVIVGGEPG